MSDTTQNRRRRYFIDRSYQSKYVALLVVFIVALGVAGILILLVGGASTAVPEAKATMTNAIIAMLMVILVFVAFTIWYGIRFSHRVVGPIYAFNRHLVWLKEGNYTRDVNLRDKDEFKKLAAAFNNMQASLRDRVRENIDAATRVETGLSELAEVLSQEGFDQEKAQELIKQLNNDLASARVKNEGFITP